MKTKRSTYLGYGVLLVAAVGLVVWWQGFPGNSKQSSDAIQVPAFSPIAKLGERAFSKNCSACHGLNASGSDSGPPLVHQIYNPGHHADEAFHRAVRQGTPQHHWRFGNMPPQMHVSAKQVSQIIAYIRELQEANGIRYEVHRM